MQVLEEFANTLSLRKGGRKGIQKLIASQMVGSIELSSGLQVSGKFSKILLNENNNVIFFKTEGPTALSYREKELIGHGINYHKDGFSSPLGKLKNIKLAIEDMGPNDLKAYNFYDWQIPFYSNRSINPSTIRIIFYKHYLCIFFNSKLTRSR